MAIDTSVRALLAPRTELAFGVVGLCSFVAIIVAGLMYKEYEKNEKNKISGDERTFALYISISQLIILSIVIVLSAGIIYIAATHLSVEDTFATQLARMQDINSQPTIGEFKKTFRNYLGARLGRKGSSIDLKILSRAMKGGDENRIGVNTFLGKPEPENWRPPVARRRVV
jgi:hypothetical protein